MVVPVRDREELLRRALASVAAQTRAPGEIIVVDDGSRDRSADVAASFSGVVVVRQEPRGVSAARNRGVATAQSPWIAFLDSDDEWLPAKLERQVEALSRRSGARVCHTDEIWMRAGRRVNPRRRHAKKGGWIFADCLPLCAISPSSVLLSRSVLDRVGGFDEDLPVCEDYDLWLRICPLYEVVLVDEPLVVKHGGRRDQLSRRHWGMDRFRVRALEKVLSSAVLAPADWAAARETALVKLDVYLQGARRRGKRAEVERWARLRGRLAALSPPAGGAGPAGAAGRLRR